MKYMVVFERGDDGSFSVYVPDLPGACLAATPERKPRANIAEAMTGHIEILREYGEPVPQPGNSTAVVELMTAVAA